MPCAQYFKGIMFELERFNVSGRTVYAPSAEAHAMLPKLAVGVRGMPEARW